jgi:dipeptidyl-peptidase 4
MSQPAPSWEFVNGRSIDWAMTSLHATLLVMRRVCRCSAVLGLWVLVSATTILVSAEKPADRSLLTLDRIFGKDEFKTQEWGPARWLKDGSGYTTLEKSETLKDARDIVRYDPESGRREVLVFASNLLARGESKPLEIEDYAWSEDTTKLLLFTNSKRVWRRNTRGDYWVFDLKRRELKKLGGQAAPSTLLFATLSPDGRRVAYVCQNNIFVQFLDNWRVTQLTTDGSGTIINGTSDWVYEEEFGLRNGFRWSPDGNYIAYWQFDTSGVRVFKLINNTDAIYPEITSYAYPKVGETNAACRVGVVKAGGGSTRWIRPNADPRNHYLPEMEWSKDSQHVVFQQLNRLQNTNQVIRADARTGDLQVLLTDRDDAWVEVCEGWHWLENGKRFLWPSERDGYQHFYAVTGTNQQISQLTPGAYDAISVPGVDEKQGCVYFIASPDNPTQRYFYRAPLDASGRIERVTPRDQPRTHSYEMSKDCRWAFHTYSCSGQPPVTDLVRLPEHQRVRVLAYNAALHVQLAGLKTCSSEFFRVGLSNGVLLDAWCIKPPGFDPGRQYPLVIYVYGEPAGTTVVDSWGGETYLWHCLLAQQGYVVMSIDNRGTAAPRGRAWRKSIYRQVGILASEDQAAATRQILQERPYLDPKRIGIWGWSGGGSMSLNAIFRHPDLYRTAMAIAFVSNQRFYETIYQERYMGLPADNAAGFRDGSPITFAHQLKGNLLLVYGTGDDNCHYQNCEALINELIKQNKQFSLMSYPNRTHAINEGENTRRHLFETLTRYLQEHLPAAQQQ